MQTHPSTPAPRSSGWLVGAVHVGALAAAVGVVILTAGSARWDLPMLGLITVFSSASELTAVDTGSTKLRISGSSLGIMLAAVLLGGGPGAVVGAVTLSTGWLRTREARHYFFNNLVAYTWFPLAAGLFFHAVAHATHLGATSPAYYLLVFAALVLALALNFVLVAGYQCYLDRSSLLRKVREAVQPILASELFSQLLTVAAVYVARQTGTVGLALFGLVLIVFGYLVSELLVSKRRSEELQRIATTDELTGLANRERFSSGLEEAIAHCSETGDTLAVMLIDLDRFKEVNDTLGHHYGDLLLRELGPRLAEHVGDDGIVARLGGDEFAVLPHLSGGDRAGLERFASGVLALVSEPFEVDEMALEVGGSLGIARYPVDGEDGATLLRRADIAMYAAKEAQSGYRFYDVDSDHHSRRRLSVLGDFRRALGAGEIDVFYQPIVDLAQRQVRAAEGLVRWHHPKLGLLAPGSFLQIVEQTGLIGPLTRYVLERSIEQCRQWREAGIEMAVAVNLSARNLLDRALPGEIERMLVAHGLPADALALEITESMIMSDPERAIATATSLSELGIRLSVDDFGTGYSSLAHLRRLPIDELKIDRSFVTPMLDEDSDLIIVRSTINLGHDLGLKIIAEGVENERTLDRLGLLGCDLAQGYHLSKPMPADLFTDWLAQDDFDDFSEQELRRAA